MLIQLVAGSPPAAMGVPGRYGLLVITMSPRRAPPVSPMPGAGRIFNL